MNTPLVSITSAFYNTGPKLLDMVKSVFTQSFSDWELILVDDGSTDNSYEFARSIKDARVRVYTNGKNMGRSKTLNRITELAQGRYIARMDSDDMSSITRIEKQVELMESQPEVDVCGTGICYLDRNDIPVGHWIAPEKHEVICRNPSRTIETCHGALLGRIEWFRKNLYNTRIKYAVDFDFLLRANRTTQFANVAEPLYFYRLDQSFSIAKQATARKISAEFLYKYHKSHGEVFSAVSNYCKQYFKLGVTTFAWAVGLREKLLKRRYQPLTDEELNHYIEELRLIKAYDVQFRKN